MTLAELRTCGRQRHEAPDAEGAACATACIQETRQQVGEETIPPARLQPVPYDGAFHEQQQ